MAISRLLNIISQMRLDVSHLRLIESGVAGDFDTVLGRAQAGNKALILRGFAITGSVGTQANTLRMVTADSIAINLNASESGSILWVPPSRASELLDGAVNGVVQGSFVPGAVNYVGIDFIRELDDTTIDLVKFLDPVTGTESDRLVPLGNVLDYKIIISTTPFSSQSTVIPVAKVDVGSTGIVGILTDARQMMFRLGSGGDVPNPYSAYSWPAGRSEGLSNSTFSGADKSFNSQKDWSDAMMTRMWELGGGAHWYSAAADRNVHMTNYGTPFANGDYFTFDSGTGATTWQGIRFLFDADGSSGTINEIDSGGGTVLDGQCVYVDLDRTEDRTVAGGDPLVAAISTLSALGPGITPGSRWILAWRVGTSLYTRGWRYPVGTTFTPATTTALGTVRLNQTPGTPLTPYVVSIMTDGQVVVAATSGNVAGGTFTGFGVGAGVSGVGSAAGSAGIVGTGTGAATGMSGTGGTTGGDGITSLGSGVMGQGSSLGGGGTGAIGVLGRGTGVGPGVRGEAAGTGSGVIGTAAGGAGNGVSGAALGTGVGVFGQAIIGGVLGQGVTNGYGVSGLAAGTGTGVSGTGGTTSGIGVEGYGGAPNGAGVFGQGDGTGRGGSFIGGDASGTGARGEGGLPNGVGIIGAGFGTGHGGQFVGGNDVTAAGVSATSGGTGPAVKGVGGSGRGGEFTSTGGDALNAETSSADALETAVSGTNTGAGPAFIGSSAIGPAFRSNSGGIIIPTPNKFYFIGDKTGYMFIPVSQLQKADGSGTAPLIWDSAVAPLNMAHYSISTGAGGIVKLTGFARFPRGATITAVKLHVANLSGVSTYSINQPIITKYNYNTEITAMAKTPILTGGPVPAAVAVSGTQATTSPGYWIPTSAPAVVTLVDGYTLGNSGIVQIDWDINAHVAAGALVAGMMITYTYTDVDFMI